MSHIGESVSVLSDRDQCASKIIAADRITEVESLIIAGHKLGGHHIDEKLMYALRRREVSCVYGITAEDLTEPVLHEFLRDMGGNKSRRAMFVAAQLAEVPRERIRRLCNAIFDVEHPDVGMKTHCSKSQFRMLMAAGVFDQLGVAFGEPVAVRPGHLLEAVADPGLIEIANDMAAEMGDVTPDHRADLIELIEIDNRLRSPLVFYDILKRLMSGTAFKLEALPLSLRAVPRRWFRRVCATIETARARLALAQN